MNWSLGHIHHQDIHVVLFRILMHMKYFTRIVNRILFHSVPYDKMNPYTLSTEEYNKLVTICSHGCVRLTCEDAKWIYDNCALKTKVKIVSRRFDPLNRPKIKKIPSDQTWDPTDLNI
ncbi:MAG: L,D-transpeptidase [Thomasclavelia sp.]